MESHHSTVFKNSCLKVPRLPHSNQPLPLYEQKILNQLENQAKKLSLDSENPDKLNMKSFIKFYDSIPEYGDINHLSNAEFYRRLESLKEKQRAYFDYLNNSAKYESKNTDWVGDYKSLTSGGGINKNPKKSSLKSYSATPNRSPCVEFKRRGEDLESLLSEDVKDNIKPPSRRSVRIESPKSSENDETPDLNYFRSKSRAGSKSTNGSIMDDLTAEDLKILNTEREFDTFVTRSLPNTPVKIKSIVGWKDSGITIPKPFQMTVRDEENKIVEDIIIKTRKPVVEKFEMFKAHSIPVESQIPLFDKIMADQEKRSQKVKKKRKAALQSQMKPFSFTQREEEIQAITSRLSKSTPSLFLDDNPIKVKKFKAKPVPKNLFSNYIYRKMYEDEFYRALQKKIRAEEMLKASALPPSMAKRDTKRIGEICPRSYREIDLNDDYLYNEKTKLSQNSVRKELLEKELEELQLDFVNESPYSSSQRKKKKKRRKSSATTRSSSTLPTNTEVDSVNRSNLAAVLRIESARKRLQDEMSSKLGEARLRDEARWRERVLRTRPGWQTSLTGYSHREDLAARLQLRRDEERLRGEEHRLRMRTMLGRVNQQPFLFERHRAASTAHGVQSREEMITRLYTDYAHTGGKYSSEATSDADTIHDLTGAQGGRSSGLTCKEMKDEGVQAEFDDMFKVEEVRAIVGDGDDDLLNDKLE